MELLRRECVSAMRWFMRQPQVEQIAVCELQRDIIMRSQNDRRAKGLDKLPAGELGLESLIKAIIKRQRIHGVRHDNRENLDSVVNARMNAVKDDNAFKSAPKRDSLEKKYQLLVLKLRKEGFSWTKCVQYLAKYHRKKVSKTYLYKIFNELEKEQQEVING